MKPSSSSSKKDGEDVIHTSGILSQNVGGETELRSGSSHKKRVLLRFVNDIVNNDKNHEAMDAMLNDLEGQTFSDANVTQEFGI